MILVTIKDHESSGKSVTTIAKNLGVPSSTLAGWIKEYREHGEKSFPGSGKIKPCNEEYKDVKMERDILKKAVAIFSEAKN